MALYSLTPPLIPRPDAKPRVYQLNDQSRQAEGLVAWYPEPYLRNLANPSLHALTNNGPATVAGSERGEVRNFTGTTGVFLSAATTVYSTLPFTVSCWAFVRNLTAAHTLVSIADTGSDINYYALSADGSTAGDPLSAVHRSHATNDAIASTTVAYPQNQWFHACAVFSSTSNRAVYLNGANRVANFTLRGAPSGLDALAYGELRRSTPANPLDGFTDDMRVYNRALTPEDVHALWDPATRWELYRQPSTRVSVSITAGARPWLVGGRLVNTGLTRQGLVA